MKSSQEPLPACPVATTGGGGGFGLRPAKATGKEHQIVKSLTTVLVVYNEYIILDYKASPLLSFPPLPQPPAFDAPSAADPDGQRPTAGGGGGGAAGLQPAAGTTVGTTGCVGRGKNNLCLPLHGSKIAFIIIFFWVHG